MASMVATCFTLQPTLHPRLAFSSSLIPYPRPLNTFPHPIPAPIFPACFSSKLQEPPRVMFPFGGAADFKGGRSPSWMPRASFFGREIDYEPIKDFTFHVVESIRSFMFGDGDPNRETNEERWKLVAHYITSKVGVVTAEELAPYLDPLETKGQNDIDNEAFMLPVLMRYEGYPVIDEENGNVLYRFMSLQPTAKELNDPDFVKKGKLLLRQKYFIENKWQFSKISILEKVVLLGFIGLCWKGIRMLTEALLRETPIAPFGYVKLFCAMLPVLQACVVAVTTIPSLRFVLFCVIFLKRNADIKKRNLARQRCAKDLESPDLELRRKLQTARDMAEKLTIVMTGQEDVTVEVYGANRSSSTKSSRDLVEDI